MGTETKWTKEICRGLEKMNCLVKVNIGGAVRDKTGRVTVACEPGWPDRYVHHTLFAVWLEFKDTKGKLSPMQKYKIDQMNRRRPGSAFVVRRMFDDGGVIEQSDGHELASFSDARELFNMLVRLSSE